MSANSAVTSASSETPISIKLTVDGQNRRFKLPLRDLNAAVFPDKVRSQQAYVKVLTDHSIIQLRSILQIPADSQASVVLERFSDSANAYLQLDPANPSGYKQLYRAAKAKLKIRMRATVVKPQAASIAHTLDEKTQLPSSSTKPVPPASTEDDKGSYQPVAPSEKHQPQNTQDSRLPCPNRDVFHEQLASISHERVCGQVSQSAGQFKTKHPSSEYIGECGSLAKEVPAPGGTGSWQVFCNRCDKPMTDVHFHCSICDSGDYDLCESCVQAGHLCLGNGHWLLKRFIQNGKVVSSTTEKIAPKARLSSPPINSMPGTFGNEAGPTSLAKEPNRTCNSCVRVLPEHLFFNCKDCDDFDLCLACYEKAQPSHHPAHAFQLLAKLAGTSSASQQAMDRLTGISHAAICDGCDVSISGVRYKCLTCPDWDFCKQCYANASTSHPGHRFAPIYEPLVGLNSGRPAAHHGVFCDGPLCRTDIFAVQRPGYIQGTRYKCAICNDLDFCASCEAHPSNKHNKTHPMIKFKTPVASASITTELEDESRKTVMGDLSSLNAQTTTAVSSNDSGLSPTQLAEEKPTVSPTNKPSTVELDAHFVKDMVADGTRFAPSEVFVQVWTLRNTGDNPWPAGCSVRHVGGDNMLNVDRTRPSSASGLAHAQESNATATDVKPGEEYDFTVKLRAPAREGKHISYWRLKAPDGTPFGHKLWCDVEVYTTADDEAIAQKHVPNEDYTRETASSEGSQMVFPKLEKESPASSTHQDVALNTNKETSQDLGDNTETETDTLNEDFHDVESLDLEESDDEDGEGFMTDEEYDILDASDEEIVKTGAKQMSHGGF